MFWSRKQNWSNKNEFNHAVTCLCYSLCAHRIPLAVKLHPVYTWQPLWHQMSSVTTYVILVLILVLMKKYNYRPRVGVLILVLKYIFCTRIHEKVLDYNYRVGVLILILMFVLKIVLDYNYGIGVLILVVMHVLEYICLYSYSYSRKSTDIFSKLNHILEYILGYLFTACWWILEDLGWFLAKIPLEGVKAALLLHVYVHPYHYC